MSTSCASLSSPRRPGAPSRKSSARDKHQSELADIQSDRENDESEISDAETEKAGVSVRDATSTSTETVVKRRVTSAGVSSNGRQPLRWFKIFWGGVSIYRWEHHIISMPKKKLNCWLKCNFSWLWRGWRGLRSKKKIDKKSAKNCNSLLLYTIVVKYKTKPYFLYFWPKTQLSDCLMKIFSPLWP